MRSIGMGPTERPGVLIGVSHEDVLKELRYRAHRGQVTRVLGQPFIYTSGPHLGHYGIEVALKDRHRQPFWKGKGIAVATALMMPGALMLYAVLTFGFWQCVAALVAVLAGFAVLVSKLQGAGRSVTVTTTTRVRVR